MCVYSIVYFFLVLYIYIYIVLFIIQLKISFYNFTNDRHIGRERRKEKEKEMTIHNAWHNSTINAIAENFNVCP